MLYCRSEVLQYIVLNVQLFNIQHYDNNTIVRSPVPEYPQYSENSSQVFGQCST